mmetsp:Transcript_75946/g.216640  ORF Transcript_75946/g.216640 Transcript_75946/m.216640 type:complete len:241 (-) Transcript_75946:585-1307(-)
MGWHRGVSLRVFEADVFARGRRGVGWVGHEPHARRRGVGLAVAVLRPEAPHELREVRYTERERGAGVDRLASQDGLGARDGHVEDDEAKPRVAFEEPKEHPHDDEPVRPPTAGAWVDCHGELCWGCTGCVGTGHCRGCNGVLTQRGEIGSNGVRSLIRGIWYKADTSCAGFRGLFFVVRGTFLVWPIDLVSRSGHQQSIPDSPGIRNQESLLARGDFTADDEDRSARTPSHCICTSAPGS